MASPSFRAYLKTGREFYLSRPRPASRWRKRSREAIAAVIEANPSAGTADLLKLVDAAYPFGQREHQPYKAWLEERKILVGDLEDVPPSADEWAAIEVAIDMQEEGRPVADVVALLDDQAPHRHGRACRTCGVRKGDPCREATALALMIDEPVGGVTMGKVVEEREFTVRLIPHAARVQP